MRLRLIGDGVPSYELELKSLASDLGVADQVEWVGRVAHREVAAWHRRSHVLIFPSEWPEPFGLAHLEAMASGCAVVSTLTGGSRELIEDRQNALAFRVGCHKDLADTLAELGSDEALRRGLIHLARRRVEERFSLNAYAERLLAFLAEHAKEEG